MFYPELNQGDQEDDHGSFGTPDALFLRALCVKSFSPIIKSRYPSLAFHPISIHNR